MGWNVPDPWEPLIIKSWIFKLSGRCENFLAAVRE